MAFSPPERRWRLSLGSATASDATFVRSEANGAAGQPDDRLIHSAPSVKRRAVKTE
jgi:hypothetical protein